MLAFAKEAAGFEEVLAATGPGHRALGLILEPESAATSNSYAYQHFPLWYQAKKRGFVDFNFANYLPQIIAPTRSRARLPAPGHPPRLIRLAPRLELDAR